MRYEMPSASYILGVFVALLVPVVASAHEVYVLTPEEVRSDLVTGSFNEVATALSNIPAFVLWGFVTVLTISAVFFVSLSRPFERQLDPVLARLRRYAAPIARITIGLSFIAAAYYQASYGPELPLHATFGDYSGAAALVLLAIGTLIVLGLLVRASAFVALVFFSVAAFYHGSYMLTYTNYLGEIVVLLILGAHHGASPRRTHDMLDRIGKAFAPYSFFILRVCFGISLLYASFYAKIIHNNLALQVAGLPLAGHAHSIAQVFGLEPHFLVMGAAIIEALIAVFFILGIEIRFTSVFLLFWLSLSLWWFGEVVWPHVILIGIPIAFICWGYDTYSLEGRFFKRAGREPVL